MLPPRIAAKLVPDPHSDCILWTGALNDPGGYGVVRWEGRQQYVHRVVYSLLVGPIPPGAQIDHVRARGCIHRHCANVAHLEPVTCQVNVLRAVAEKAT